MNRLNQHTIMTLERKIAQHEETIAQLVKIIAVMNQSMTEIKFKIQKMTE